ncbi:MAG: class I adenylate-forming enzyme family protein [Acidobacteriota bacterium]
MVTRSEAIARLTAPGEDYELVVEELYGQPCRTFKNAPRNLHQLYFDTRSDETFFVYGEERLTFEEMYLASARVARLLVDGFGIEPGDRVAISMRNYPEWVQGFMAVTSIGAVAVCMNALWTSEEMQYGLEDSGAKVLLADQERVDRIVAMPGCVEDCRVIAVRPGEELPAGIPDLADALAGIEAVMPEVDVAPEADATIFYTSGSTGHPKGVVSCHRNILHALLSWELDGQATLLERGEEAPELEIQLATLLAVPLFHVTGSHAVYLSCYRNQRKMVSMYKWNPEEAAELIEREKITSFVAPAAMTGDLVRTAARTNADLGTLLQVGGGGAPRAPEQVGQIDESFTNALPGTGWGMSETNAIGVGIGGEDYLHRPASSGRCSAVLDLRIVDEEENEVPIGERGELQVRGTSVFRGYWNRPEATAETFAEGRWLKTGDVATIDEDGFVFIVDRIKDLVIRGGENIGCGQVEAALLEHPLVLEACVFAVPDDRLGEEVGASVYSREVIDEGELREFLAERLAKFEVPRYFFLTAEPLPRIASGKIYKRGLREEAVTKLSS